MKKSNWLSILVAVAIMAPIIGTWRWIQHEYVNACRVSVCSDMDQIRQAVLAYQQKNGALPENLQVLVPEYLSKTNLNRKLRTSLAKQKVLVPANPYGLRGVSKNSTNSFDVTCAFYGKGYTGIVMHASGEIDLE